jgi:TonB-dependent receptor
MKRFLLFILLLMGMLQLGIAQQGVVTGIVSDSKTGETLPACQLVLQGTSSGAITDFEGKFVLRNIAPGNYNLVSSYISYDNLILSVNVKKGDTVRLDIRLNQATVTLAEVTVNGTRRANTEMSMISALRAGDLIANGISSQQIERSLDKDASEVVRRVPGVSIRDGKFVVVRGLTERYNTVWLNGASTPSSEIDRRAFSFDAIPSDLIDNILIYKTPAPELPADFSGAMINLKSKTLVDKNSINFSYSAGYLQNSTFGDFYSYQGGKTDWLGYDDGTRALPADFPSTTDLRRMADNPTPLDKEEITRFGQEFSTIWTPGHSRARPDQSFNISIKHRFTLGKFSISNISALTYSNTLSSETISRAAYQSYDTIRDQSKFSYDFTDFRYSQKVRVGALMNWIFIFGNNQRIEFRNLFNQLGASRTTLRDGQNFYGGSYERSYELAYESRAVYSGQLGGQHSFNQDNTKVDWTLGYSFGNKNQPDTRRVTSLKGEDYSSGDPFTLSVNFNADPNQLGRLYLKNNENIYVAGANLQQRVNLGVLIPEIKAGFYTEFKDRQFAARNIGLAAANFARFNFNLTRLVADTSNVFSDLVFNRVDSILVKENINSTNGFKIDESTNLSDSYQGSNRLVAGYLGILFPIANIVDLYAGVRAESNLQKLDGFNEIGHPVNVNNNYFNLFPSINLSTHITEDLLFRLAYGKTVNRPEFREIAPYAFYDFEEKATIYGNDSLKNAYVHNIDARIEWYPTPGEMITLGGFYKKFDNPIEAHLKDFGTGWNYMYFNAGEARSLGLELDIRKTLTELKDAGNFLSFFKDFTFVVNASLIKSSIINTDPTERDSVRQLQGQSPYLVNAGIYYQKPDAGLSVNLMYNRIGERIAYVGDVNNPHIWEMPFNSLDLSIDIKLAKNLVLKAGIRNLLDDTIAYKQYEQFNKDITGDGIGDGVVTREELTRVYQPGRLFKIGLTLGL